MAGLRLTEIPVVFYRTATGIEPVREWLRSLPEADRRAIGLDLATVQVGLAGRDATLPPVERRLVGGAQHVAKPPHCAGVVFVHEGRLGVVHGFIKENAEDTARRFGSWRGNGSRR